MHFFPLRRLIVPALLLGGAAVFRENWAVISPVYRPLLDWLPYITLGAASGLAAFYNRSRLFTLGLMLLLVYGLIGSQLQIRLIGERAIYIYSMLSLAIPFTLLLLLLLPERGLRNRYGLLMILPVPLQFFAAWLLLAHFPNAVTAVVNGMPLLPFGNYYLSWIASGGFLVCFMAGLLVLCRYDSEHAAAVMSALIFVFVTLAFFRELKISVVMFSAAGIGLLISLLRNSYDMAYYDELTGLRGRRALNERLKGLGNRYTIAMTDIDHFKKFNDSYGHDAGDEVLKMVAAQLARVKGGGKAYRYGGEEFCILFPGKELAQCVPHLEDVRAAIEDYELSLRDRKTRPRSKNAGRRERGHRGSVKMVSVTISIGAAERNDRNAEPMDVLKAADTALYSAKKKGRNCLVH